MSELHQQIEIYRKAYKVLAKKIKRKEIEEKVKELMLKKLKRHKPAENGNSDSKQKNSDDLADSSDEEVHEQKKKDKPRKEILNTYNCKVCETNYRTEENLRLHEKTHLFRTKKKWSCGICLYNFLTEARLKFHKCRGKDGSDDELVCLDQLYSCSDCFAAYKKQEDLAEHRKVNHLSKFVCNICSKSFMFKVALDKHMLVHVQTKEYHCKMCNKICKTETALKAHNVVHQKDIMNVALSALKSNKDLGIVKGKSKTSSNTSTFPKPKRAQRDRKRKLVNDGSDIEEVEPNAVEVPTFNLECIDGNDTDESTHQEYSDSSVTEDTSNLTKTSFNNKDLISRVPVNTNFQPVVKVLKLAALENTSNTLPIKLAVPVHLKLGDQKPKCQLCYATFNSKEQLIDHIEIHLGRRIELRSNPRSSIVSDVPSIFDHDLDKLTSNSEETSQNPKKKRGRPIKTKAGSNKTVVSKKQKAVKKKRGRPAKSVTMHKEPSIFECSSEVTQLQKEQEISGFTSENTVFDPNYIIKVEPEEGDTQSFSSDLCRQIDLDEMFIVIENGNKRVKVSEFLKTLRKPAVDLSLYNMLV